MTDIRQLCSATILLIVAFVASLWISGNAPWLLEQIRPAREAEHIPPPDGYLSVEDYVADRRQAFPALHPTPPPAPVAGTGRLEEIYDYWPAGTDAQYADVKALRIERGSAPHLVAYLDDLLDPELLDYLRNLSRGDPVAVSGIGHGRGQYAIYVYPVHRINGREP